ncbi:MAG: hypothetical protein IRZ16_03875 [Myxococcaceae bacterium]|nr:hypothetical protein [Myxococcaceae bacterium]
MSRNVKGTLFVDYVRMLRLRKDVDWSQRLHPGDLKYLSTRIEPDAWYPMETFERMGLAILNVIADGNLEMVHQFGKAQVDWQTMHQPGLIAEADPRESLMRFHVMRRSFFDYAALDVRKITAHEAQIAIDYQMGDVAEEAASLQTMGFFERLLELAGAKDVLARFSAERWQGARETLLDLRWR